MQALGMSVADGDESYIPSENYFRDSRFNGSSGPPACAGRHYPEELRSWPLRADPNRPGIRPLAEYLRLQIEGGTRTPSGRAIAVPTSNVKLNKYGNLIGGLGRI